MRRALMNYAAAIELLWTKRLYSSLQEMVPPEARERFTHLIHIDIIGDYQIAPSLDAAISDAAEACKREEEERSERRKQTWEKVQARLNRPATAAAAAAPVAIPAAVPAAAPAGAQAVAPTAAPAAALATDPTAAAADPTAASAGTGGRRLNPPRTAFRH